VYDLLMSADMLVDDATSVVHDLERSVFLPPPHRSWHQAWEGWGFEAYWCRVSPDLATAPTRLQVISPLGEPSPSVLHPAIGTVLRSYGDRPVKLHSTPVGVQDVRALAERLEKAGAAYRVDEPDEIMPFPRLWVGRPDAHDPASYDPTVDGGLFLEFVPTEELLLPESTAAAADPDPSAAGPLVRVERKSFLTEDLDLFLERLERNLDWAPREVRTTAHGRSALLGFNLPHSADLEILQPAESSPEASVLDSWGPGPYLITLSVRDIGEAAALLAEAGVGVLDHGTTSGYHYLDVDRAHTGGAPVRLVDWVEWTAIERGRTVGPVPTREEGRAP